VAITLSPFIFWLKLAMLIAALAKMETGGKYKAIT
jgi:hypothetical protein